MRISALAEIMAKEPKGQSALRNQRGQIVVEYVLLLVIGVVIATTMTTLMVSRSPESPGFVVVRWLQVIQTIGQDYADDVEAE